VRRGRWYKGKKVRINTVERVRTDQYTSKICTYCILVARLGRP
jgi:hypothetical protein